MRLEYSRRAIADLFWIADYLREKNARAADRTKTEIRHAIELLPNFPELGRFEPDLAVHSMVVRVRRRSFTVFYRIVGDIILIAHIRDGRRKPVKPGEV